MPNTTNPNNRQTYEKTQNHIFNFRFNRTHGHVGHDCPTYIDFQKEILWNIGVCALRVGVIFLRWHSQPVGWAAMPKTTNPNNRQTYEKPKTTFLTFDLTENMDMLGMAAQPMEHHFDMGAQDAI